MNHGDEHGAVLWQRKVNRAEDRARSNRAAVSRSSPAANPKATSKSASTGTRKATSTTTPAPIWNSTKAKGSPAKVEASDKAADRAAKATRAANPRVASPRASRRVA